MIYLISKIIFSTFFYIMFKWEVKGKENIPKKGPVILCANHISWWDPPIIACSIQRKVHYMAKEELFHNPLARYILTSLGAFPIRRKEADRRAIRKSLQILKEGKVLGLFPEGTRSKTGELLKPEAGVALIALKSKAPIVPIAVRGPYKFFKPIKIIIGEPFYLINDDHKLNSQMLQKYSDEIMDKIQNLLDVH
ncbi:MAG TPA: 1-acyl-sn-glycerol-3-phosphate acyltransferase [Thermoanaerobacterales bacterium]|nr:1-acyl-sn-glycerol-3-phosphate acyltransferase [Thermoanaerobacterales bacterium]